jgi:glycosyltransferase involved in cell wall biosynthesis
VTIHDCTHRKFPQFHLEENLRAAEEGIRFALDRDAFFIANSEATRREFLSEYGVDPSRIAVTSLAVDRSRFRKSGDREAMIRVRSRYGFPADPYFLALSTLEPRKNLINAAKAFVSFRKDHPEARTCLVIAGKEGWKFGDLLSDQSARDDRIFFTGYIEEEDLPLLYSNAVALLFVSHYEGFGLPALEAMSCGSPVVFSNRGALPEVVGEGGLSADPDDVEDIKRKLVQLAFDIDLRKSLSSKALARSDDFSWEKTARDTLEIYLRVARE